MYIRYQHVRNIAIGAGVLGVLSCCGWCIASPSTPDTSARPSVTHVATRTPQTSSTNAPTSDDGRIIQLISRSASPNGKLKDALGASSPIKVNVYEDDGDTRWDRVKLDRDRDGRGEETWIRKNDTWTRNDGAEVWDGQRWAAPGAARRRTGKATDGKTDLVDVAQLMLTQRATSDKIKDLKAGNGPKINLYDEDKNGTWDRAKVDLDRDDNWDEKWTVKNGTVERTIEKSGKTFVLDGDNMRSYSALNFVGIEFLGNKVDASGMDYFHIDVFAPFGSEFKVKFVVFSAGNGFLGQTELTFNAASDPAFVPGQWSSLDIPLSDFTFQPAQESPWSSIGQLVLSTADAQLVLLDNMYWHR